MPRRKAAIKRRILPDPVYGSELLAKFINVVMRKGKKSLAEEIVYKSLNFVVEQSKKVKSSGAEDKSSGAKKGMRGAGAGAGAVMHPEALEVLEKALNNIRPTVEVKSRRVGGATYQVPVEVDPSRGLALGMRMLANAAKKRGEKTMHLRLAAEILDAMQNRGAAVKERDDMHRMARANQAFAHYRW